MTVPDSTPYLDENEDWPTHGTYEYSPYYSSRKQVHVYEDAATRTHLEDTGFDYVVVGAGPIGAALAYRLAADNPSAQVLVIEKNWSEPDRIVGELMQPSGCQALGELGLTNVFSGIGAVPVHGYYLSYKGKHTYIPYMDRPNSSTSQQKRYRGVSFHHGRLVMNLRAACKAQRNVFCVEGSVTELLGDRSSNGSMDAVHGVRIGPSRSTPETEARTTPVRPRILTLVCDGITSQFRKVLNDTPIELLSHFCGFVLEHSPADSTAFFNSSTAGAMPTCSSPTEPTDNPLPMPHNGNVLLDGVGPVLLYQMSECETRVLADIPGSSLPSEAGGHLRSVLRASLSTAAPKHMYPVLHMQLMSRLESARRIRCIGSKFIPATANRIAGALWIGDALNVRHPLTGGGMTIGLWDVVHLTRLLNREPHLGGEIEDAQRRRIVQRVVAEWQWRRRAHALVVNVLSVALHALFAAETKELGLLREACFAYLARGGDCTMHPSGFLSGLLASPLLLVYHFFSVAALAVWMRVSGASSAYTGGNVFFRIYSAMYTLYMAASVILPLLWQELRP
ncbi:Squalene epoxidase [Coemansia sp. RSA 1813]|nr:Squalene epoxidase [Coemansia sp. RSA 1646]KAJ1768779.1 Squalene epoxidase [Coemansia sp. RSA 1843]KAJ2086380.1 Squalene epoxidase [Coemansia sp. RSA 986]KAJ2212305.1 Squalene epoxidase [Coemansia sp. RSA 487]KAJ2565590.1 Squalene epoxidase [Coemansia sp. RSA 1813]